MEQELRKMGAELFSTQDTVTVRGGALHGADGLYAVSYTHLDVYKRQGVFCKTNLHSFRSPFFMIAWV